jgi:hypothetical protein
VVDVIWAWRTREWVTTHRVRDMTSNNLPYSCTRCREFDEHNGRARRLDKRCIVPGMWTTDWTVDFDRALTRNSCSLSIV